MAGKLYKDLNPCTFMEFTSFIGVVSSGTLNCYNSKTAHSKFRRAILSPKLRAKIVTLSQPRFNGAVFALLNEGKF